MYSNRRNTTEDDFGESARSTISSGDLDTKDEKILQMEIEKFQTGTLILVAKFAFNFEDDIAPAIMLVGDDTALSANKEKIEEKVFIKKARSLKGEAHLQFLREFGLKSEDSKEKVISLGIPPTRGLAAVAGDRTVFKHFQDEMPAKMAPIYGREKNAEDKIMELLRNEPVDAVAEIIHAHFDVKNERKVFQRSLTEAILPRMLNTGISGKKELLKPGTAYCHAIGLGSEDQIIKQWCELTFGKDTDEERQYDQTSLENALAQLAEKLVPNYGTILGSKFKGFVIINIPADVGKSIYVISSKLAK